MLKNFSDFVKNRLTALIIHDHCHKIIINFLANRKCFNSIIEWLQQLFMGRIGGSGWSLRFSIHIHIIEEKSCLFTYLNEKFWRFGLSKCLNFLLLWWKIYKNIQMIKSLTKLFSSISFSTSSRPESTTARNASSKSQSTFHQPTTTTTTTTTTHATATTIATTATTTATITAPNEQQQQQWEQ